MPIHQLLTMVSPMHGADGCVCVLCAIHQLLTMVSPQARVRAGPHITSLWWQTGKLALANRHRGVCILATRVSLCWDDWEGLDGVEFRNGAPYAPTGAGARSHDRATLWWVEVPI